MEGLSSLRVPSLQEAAGDPVLSEGRVLPVHWEEKLILALDWRKLVELSRAMAVSSGFEPGRTRIWLDGMAEFTMTRGTAPVVKRTLARLAPWNRWMASCECIQKFAAVLAEPEHQGMKGVYLAPAGASASALIEASRHRIDVLDAEGLAEALNGLPSEHSEYFHDVTMSGQPTVPSCPVCLRSLSQTNGAAKASGATGRRLPDLSYHTSDIVAEPIVARRIEILRGCEVHFLREVRARDVFIQGVVIGDFVCDGQLLLNPGAVLTGNVAARSVLVRPGAELNGETRIVSGDLGSVEKSTGAWIWTCDTLPKQKGCEAVCFMPH